MAKRYYPLDALLLFRENLVSAASGVIADASATPVVIKIGAGRQDMTLVVDVFAIKTTAGNEHYSFVLQGCNDAAFSGPIENLAVIGMGASGARQGGAQTSTIGQYAIPLSNDLVQQYTYVRLNLIEAGTSPSITTTTYLSIPLGG